MSEPIDIEEVARWGRHLNNTQRRADLYNKAFPARPPLAFGGSSGMVTGTWMIGSCYVNPSRMPDGSPFYGGYPHGYLERIHPMFPDARSVLHVFSGGLTHANARAAARVPVQPGDGHAPLFYTPRMELVDMHGPDQGRHPTWQGDVLALPEDWEGRFDLILADPPYSADDAKKYGCPPPNRAKIMRALREVCAKGANLVWLDQCWPMHRKTDWKTWGTVGLVRSTNHRVRLVSMFEAV